MKDISLILFAKIFDCGIR